MALNELSTELYSQACLNARGYVVIGSMQLLTIGELSLIDDQPGTESDIQAIVVSQTDRADMEQQLRLMNDADNIPRINAKYFYRLVAE